MLAIEGTFLLAGPGRCVDSLGPDRVIGSGKDIHDRRIWVRLFSVVVACDGKRSHPEALDVSENRGK